MGRRGLLARALAKDSVLRHMDWVLIVAVLALALIGTLLVWSATRTGLEQAGGNPNTYLEKQLLNVAIGLVLLIAVSLIDYRILRMATPLVYAAACLGLLVVLGPLGATVNGAHSWIALPGGFQIEPSEFAKIGMILMLAVILGELRDRPSRPGAGGAVAQLAEDHRQHQDHPDLGELRRLDLEPAGQRDPGVRAVDRGAQRAEHHQQPQAGGRVDQRRGHPQYPVVDQADRDQEHQPDDHVEQLLLQVGVRVAARLLQPRPGRG